MQRICEDFITPHVDHFKPRKSRHGYIKLTLGTQIFYLEKTEAFTLADQLVDHAETLDNYLNLLDHPTKEHKSCTPTVSTANNQPTPLDAITAAKPKTANASAPTPVNAATTQNGTASANTPANSNHSVQTAVTPKPSNSTTSPAPGNEQTTASNSVSASTSKSSAATATANEEQHAANESNEPTGINPT